MIQRITSLQPLRLANGPVRPKSALWRRPQCPGIGTHSRAFPNFPWQFTLENCQSATGVTAIINRQALRIATYSLETLCSRMLRPATEKQFSVVQKLWTTRLPCGNLRKTVDEIARTKIMPLRMATFHAHWAKVLENIPDPSTTMSEVHNVVAARVPAYAAGKHVDLDWSDKSTLKMANEAGIPNQFHAWAFNYSSGFVHPSGVFFIRHLSQGPGEVFEVSTKPQDHDATFALRISHSLILNALNLRLKYAPSTLLQEGVERCKKDFVKIWGYPSPI